MMLSRDHFILNTWSNLEMLQGNFRNAPRQSLSQIYDLQVVLSFRTIVTGDARSDPAALA